MVVLSVVLLLEVADDEVLLDEEFGDDSLDVVLLSMLGNELEVDDVALAILAVSNISVDSPLSVVTFGCCCTASLILLPLLVDNNVSSLVFIVVVLLHVVRPTVGRDGDVPILFLCS